MVGQVRPVQPVLLHADAGDPGQRPVEVGERVAVLGLPQWVEEVDQPLGPGQVLDAPGGDGTAPEVLVRTAGHVQDAQVELHAGRRPGAPESASAEGGAADVPPEPPGVGADLLGRRREDPVDGQLPGGLHQEGLRRVVGRHHLPPAERSVRVERRESQGAQERGLAGGRGPPHTDAGGGVLRPGGGRIAGRDRHRIPGRRPRSAWGGFDRPRGPRRRSRRSPGRGPAA